mgnify:FL=1
MLWYHVSLIPVEEFVPRIPQLTYETEDRTQNRICVTSNLQKAFQASPQMGNILSAFLTQNIHPIVYVYTFHSKDFNEDEYLKPKKVKQYVEDAERNEEYWLLVKPRQYSCRKFYVTSAWIKTLTDMFGIQEKFCIHVSLKLTKCKLDNYDILLNYFKNSKYLNYIKVILECNVSFRNKIKYLVSENLLKMEDC